MLMINVGVDVGMKEKKNQDPSRLCFEKETTKRVGSGWPETGSHAGRFRKRDWGNEPDIPA